MNCKNCSSVTVKMGVVKTWHSGDGETIYRRRECPRCYEQFETAESARVLEIQNAFDALQVPLARIRYKLTNALSELDTVDTTQKFGKRLTK